MNSSPGKVSVIVRCYNREETLGRAIQSVLQQSYRNFELIVVDDGSTDHSAEVAQSFPEVNYIFQTNQGLAGARETGLRNAHGEYVAFLDADDFWMPAFLARSMEALQNDGHQLVFSNWQTEGPGVTHESKLELDRLSYLADFRSLSKSGWHTLSPDETRGLFMNHQPAVTSATIIRRDRVSLAWKNQAVSADDWLMILEAILSCSINCAFQTEKLWTRWIDGKNICEGTSDMGNRARNEIHDLTELLNQFGSKLTPSERKGFEKMREKSCFDLAHIASQSGRSTEAFRYFLKSRGAHSDFRLVTAIGKIPLHWLRAITTRRPQ